MSQKWPNLVLGWVKVMCDEFGEVSGIIDLVINFLAGGTLFLNSYDTLSYLLFPLSEEIAHPNSPGGPLLCPSRDQTHNVCLGLFQNRFLFLARQSLKL